MTKQNHGVIGTQKKYLNEGEIVNIYGIGVRQLRLMRLRGTGPKFIKPSGSLGQTGGRVLYSVEDLEIWLSTRPSGGGGDGATPAPWPPTGRESR
jgi:hypothetical protein